MKLEHPNGYRKPSLKQAVSGKLQVLRDFYIVDDRNRKKFKQILLDAVAKYPNRDYEIVLDQTAAQIISDYLDNKQGVYYENY